jgi:beta-N-acetylglucosaminidase
MACNPVATPDDAPAAGLAAYPALRYSKLSTLGASVRSACVDTSALPSHAKLDALVPNILAEAGLSLAETGSCGCDWWVVFSANPPELSTEAATVWAAAGDNPERYAGVSGSVNGRPVTTLYAPSERGALYATRATMSLYQHTRVALGSFVDYPEIASRGLVEAIYGPTNYCDTSTTFWLPWRVQDRSEAIRVESRLRMNKFIYGPKCDYYTSPAGWREDYPTSDGQVVSTAARVADSALVDFVWSVRPLTFFDAGTYADNLGALESKLAHVRALGVRHFALFWDDSFDYGGTVQQQVQLMNEVDSYLRAIDPSDHLIVVGQPYCGPVGGPSGTFCDGPNANTDLFGTGLHADIEIMWTGPAVEPQTVAAADLTAINHSYHRNVALWDNWPCAGGAECPGSHYTGRSADLGTAVRSVYINPVLNEYPGPANPIRSFMEVMGDVGSYTWNPHGYDEHAADTQWQALLETDEKIDGPCLPCTTDPAGWTCDASDQHQIHFCDFTTACETVLPCPGGCETRPQGEPDVCH